MKNCPKCNSLVIGVDTLAIFAFEKKIPRVIWLIFSVFLVLLWSGLVLGLAPETIKWGVLLIYYILGALLVYKLYKNNLEKVIYECPECKTRYKGNSPEPFRYND